MEWLKPEEKVSLAISMTDACVRVCADSIRDLYPGIGEGELLEIVRERVSFGRRLKAGSRSWKPSRD
ncbi:MAG: hypothetical protein QXU06_03625 [Candidatus Bathyarchaeia archaeon]